MDKTKLQTLKGFRDFLPEKMNVRNEVIGRLSEVFKRYGFEEIQTPTLEYQDVLLGKYGEEAEKLMYLFEDRGGRKVGMRYDLTIPLARVLSENQNIPKPFKRYQIQPVWRADKPQRGRYREFYQCDIDIIGSSAPLSDAEVIATISDGLVSLDITNFKIRVNSRDVLFKSMQEVGINEEDFLQVTQSIDKLDKKSREEVAKELKNKGLENTKIEKLFDSLTKARPNENLTKVVEYAERMGVENIEFAPTLARGLDYYTGFIFEAIVDKPDIGSVAGGGRYDNLIKTLGGPDLPATGGSIGLDRVADVIEEQKLWINNQKGIKVLVTLFSDDFIGDSILVAQTIRNAGINAALYPDSDSGLDKQLKYANKKDVPFVIIIGPEEVEKERITLKNMKSGDQTSLTLGEALDTIETTLTSG